MVVLMCVCGCVKDNDRDGVDEQVNDILRVLNGDWYTITHGEGGLEQSVVWIKVHISVHPDNVVKSAWYSYLPLSGESMRWGYIATYSHVMTKDGSCYESDSFTENNMHLRYDPVRGRFTVKWGDGLLEGTIFSRDNPYDDMGEYKSWLD